MLENWAYAALAEHIYRRNQQSDQALREADFAGKGGLSGNEANPNVLFNFDGASFSNELNALGLFVSEGRYIYNPDTGFEATIAQGAAGELIVVFRGTDSLDCLPHPRKSRSAESSARIAWASPPTGRPGAALARQA